MPMENVTDHHVYTYTIRNTETDFRDRIHLQTLFSMLQEAASLNANVYDLGAERLDPMNMCWLLLRVSVRMKRMPAWMDTIHVETWSRGADKIYFMRDFIIRDDSGEELGAASSVWIVVDRDSHRPVRPTNLLEYAKVASDPQRVFEDFDPPKLSAKRAFGNPEDCESHSTVTKRADYSEIDRNHHVNNTRYVAWCLDTFYKDKTSWRTVTGIDINYFSEIHFGSKIYLHLDESGADAQIDGYVAGSSKPAFSAVLYAEQSEE